MYVFPPNTPQITNRPQSNREESNLQLLESTVDYLSAKMTSMVEAVPTPTIHRTPPSVVRPTYSNSQETTEIQSEREAPRYKEKRLKDASRIEIMNQIIDPNSTIEDELAESEGGGGGVKERRRNMAMDEENSSVGESENRALESEEEDNSNILREMVSDYDMVSGNTETIIDSEMDEERSITSAAAAAAFAVATFSNRNTVNKHNKKHEEEEKSMNVNSESSNASTDTDTSSNDVDSDVSMKLKLSQFTRANEAHKDSVRNPNELDLDLDTAPHFEYSRMEYNYHNDLAAIRNSLGLHDGTLEESVSLANEGNSIENGNVIDGISIMSGSGTGTNSGGANINFENYDNIVYSTMELECMAGYDGGLQQRFYLEAYDSKTQKLRLNTTSTYADVPIFRIDLSGK